MFRFAAAVAATIGLVVGLVGASGGAPPAQARGATHAEVGTTGVPHYDHLFVLVEENHGFGDVIGNPAAPNLNALAKQYGLATGYGYAG